jgi:hemoglobin/transferrin/lactoferrin receptor protein
VIVPNPDLQSEYAYNFDLGLSKTFGEGLTANLNAFYTILDNALIRQTTTFNGADSIIYDGSKSQVLSIQNGAGATVWGVQLGISGKFDNGIGYRTNFNYQDGEEETEDGEALPLRHAAPPFGLVQLSWEKGQFYIAGMLEWNGEISNSNLPLSEQAKPHLYDSDEEGRPYCPSWSTVSLKVRYVPHPSLSVTGGIENILDKRYRPYSSGIVAPGRNWILSAIYRF